MVTRTFYAAEIPIIGWRGVKFPVLYVHRRGERVLYVGMSRSGIRRAIFWNRQRQPWRSELLPTDRVTFYMVPEELADDLPLLEEMLIEELAPEECHPNRPGGPARKGPRKPRI